MADDSLTIDLEPQINFTGLKNQTKQMQKELQKLSKADANGIPGLEKGSVQAAKFSRNIDKLTKGMEKAASKKFETAEYEQAKSTVADLQKEFDKVGKSVQDLEPKTKAARAKVKELRDELKTLQGQKFDTDDYKRYQKELTATDKKIETLTARLEKMQYLGQDVLKTGKNKGKASKQYEGVLYDLIQAEDRANALNTTIAKLKKSGAAYKFGDHEKEAELNKQIKEAAANSVNLGKEFAARKAELAELESKLEDANLVLTKLKLNGKQFTMGDKDKVIDFARLLAIELARSKSFVDEAQSVGDELYTSLFGKLKQAPKTISATFDNIKSDAKTMSDAFKSTDTFAALSNSAKNAFSKIKQSWKTSAMAKLIGDAVWSAKDDFESLKQRGAGVFGSIKKAWTSSAVFEWAKNGAQDVKEKFDEIKYGISSNKVFQKIKSEIQKIKNEFQKVSGAFQRVRSVFSRFKNDAGTIWSTFKTTNAFDGIKNKAKSAFAFVKNKAGNAFGNVNKSLNDTHRIAGKVFTKIKNSGRRAFNSILSNVKSVVKSLFNIKKVSNVASKTFGNIRKAAKSAFSGIRKNTESSKKHLLRSIVQYGFAARSVFFLYRKIRAQFFESLKALAADIPAFNETMSSLSNTFDQMKNSIATAAQPLVTALAPALEWIMEKAIAAANAIGTFIATLTGQKVIYKTVKGNKSYAESADDAADATGRQSKALDELNEKLGEYDKLSVIGEENNKNKANTGGSSGGIDDDSGTHFVAETVDANTFAQQLRDAWNAEDWEGLGELIGGKINEVVTKIDEAVKWENVGDEVTTWVTNFGKVFNSLMTTVDWHNIGVTIGDGLTSLANAVQVFLDTWNLPEIGTAFAEVMNGIKDSLDFSAVGTAVGTAVNTIKNTIKNFVNKTQWEDWGTKLSTGVNAFIGTVEWSDLSKTMISGIGGIADAIKGFATGVDWAQLANGTSDFINGLDNAAVFKKVKNAINALLSGVKTFVQNYKWGSFGSVAANMVNAIFDIDWENPTKAITTAINGVATSIKTFVTKIKWDKIAGVASKIVTAIFDVDEKTISTTFTTAIAGAKKVVISALKAVQWGKMLSVVADIVNAIFTLDDKDFKDLQDTITNIGNALVDFIKAVDWELIGINVGALLAQIDWVSVLGAAAKAIWDALTGLIKGLLFGKEPDYNPEVNAIIEGRDKQPSTGDQETGAPFRTNANGEVEVKFKGTDVDGSIANIVQQVDSLVKTHFMQISAKNGLTVQKAEELWTEVKNLLNGGAGKERVISFLTKNGIKQADANTIWSEIETLLNGGKDKKRKIDVKADLTGGDKTKSYNDLMAEAAQNVKKAVQLADGGKTKEATALFSEATASVLKAVKLADGGKTKDATTLFNEAAEIVYKLVELESGGKTADYSALITGATKTENKLIKLGDGGTTENYREAQKEAIATKHKLIKLGDGGTTTNYDNRIKNGKKTENKLIKLGDGGTTENYDKRVKDGTATKNKLIKLGDGGTTQNYTNLVADATSTATKPVVAESGQTETELKGVGTFITGAIGAGVGTVGVKATNGTTSTEVDSWWTNVKTLWDTNTKDKSLSTSVTNSTSGSSLWSALQTAWNTARKKDAPTGYTYKPLSAGARVATTGATLWSGVQTDWWKARKKDAPKGYTYKPLDAGARVATTGATLWKNVQTNWDASKGTLYSSAYVSSITVDKTALASYKKKFNGSITFTGSGTSLKAEFKARGGIIQNPVIAGEAGREAIIPLEHHTEWINKVADGLMARLKLSTLKIPQLALGKVLPTNSEFLQTYSQSTSNAMSMSMLEQALDNVFSRYMNQSEQPIYVQLNGKTIAEAVRYENAKRNRQLV